MTDEHGAGRAGPGDNRAGPGDGADGHRAARSRSAELRFGVLGSLRIEDRSGEIALTSEKQRLLLAALIVRVGTVVSAGRLAGVLWGERPTPSADKSLQTYVARLRRCLGFPAGTAGPLLTRPPGYLLDVDPGQIDALRFARLRDRASEALATDPARALALLDEALGLWRGDALAEFCDLDFARAEAERLEELRTCAHEDRFDAELALGRHQAMIGPLDAFTARHPYRERPHAQLMLALYRSGRHADALAVFARFRDRLAAELGLEPSGSLRALETGILRQRADLMPVPAPVGTPAPASPPVPVRTPPPVGASSPTPAGPPPIPANPPPIPASPLIGRDVDLAAALEALGRARLLTITGPPGVGKTRLAVAVARAAAERFPDGVHWCELGSIVDDTAVLGALGTACGVPRQGDETPQATLGAFLGRRAALLVIDGCEPVVQVTAALVEELLERCARLVVLTTTRTPLHVSGEHLHPLAPLPGSAAVRLFVERASAVDPGFTLGGANRSFVETICARLDGLPLAIELAAAQVRLLTPAELAARLAGRADLAPGIRRTRVARHRSLEDTIGWSYDLLEPAQRRALRWVSVFAGEFEAEAARAVAAEADRGTTPAGAGPAAVADVDACLDALVDHSLLLADRTGTATRYSMLATVRGFAGTRLRAAGERALVERCFGSWVGSLTESAAQTLRGPAEAGTVARLDREFPNLRAAHRWAVAEGATDHALRISAALHEYAYHRLRDEVFDWAQAALALDDAPGHPLFPVVQGSLACGLLNRGQLAAACTLAREALAACGSDHPSALRALHALALAALYEGRLADAVALATREADCARQAGDRYQAAFATLTLVLAHAYADDIGSAVALAADQQRMAERCQNPSQLAWARYGLGEALRSTDPDRALRLLDGAVEEGKKVRNDFAVGVALVTLATLVARTGDLDRALESLLGIVGYWRQRGNRTHLWTTLRNLVVVLARRGADEPAAVLLGAVTDPAVAPPPFGADSQHLAAVGDAVRDRLGADRYRALLDRGRGLDPDQVLEFVERAVRTAPPRGTRDPRPPW